MTVFDLRRIVWSSLTGLALAVCVAAIWRAFDASSLPLGSPSNTDFLIAFAILLIGHEALHLLGFPGAGCNSNTVIGIWPQLVAPYVQYLSPMRRNRFMFATVLPFVVISLLPLIFAALHIGPTNHLSWFSVLNCLGVGSDIFILAKLLAVVPASASVVESDWKLYWAIL